MSSPRRLQKVLTASIIRCNTSGNPSTVRISCCGLAASRGQARKDIEGGGVYLNGERVAGDRALTSADLLHGRIALLRKGKRSFATVRGPLGA